MVSAQVECLILEGNTVEIIQPQRMFGFVTCLWLFAFISICVVDIKREIGIYPISFVFQSPQISTISSTINVVILHINSMCCSI